MVEVYHVTGIRRNIFVLVVQRDRDSFLTAWNGFVDNGGLEDRNWYVTQTLKDDDWQTVSKYNVDITAAWSNYTENEESDRNKQ